MSRFFAFINSIALLIEHYKSVFQLLSDSSVSIVALQLQIDETAALPKIQQQNAPASPSTDSSSSSSLSEEEEVSTIQADDPVPARSWWNPFDTTSTQVPSKEPEEAMTDAIKHPPKLAMTPPLPGGVSEDVKNLLVAWYWAGYYAAKIEDA